MAKEKVAAKIKAKAKGKTPAAKTDSAILGDIVSRARPANAGDVEVYIVTAPDFEILKQLSGEV